MWGPGPWLRRVGPFRRNIRRRAGRSTADSPRARPGLYLPPAFWVLAKLASRPSPCVDEAKFLGEKRKSPGRSIDQPGLFLLFVINFVGAAAFRPELPSAFGHTFNVADSLDYIVIVARNPQCRTRRFPIILSKKFTLMDFFS